MIISSSIFSARASYTHTFVALTLLVMLAFAEYNFLIPHYSLGAISYQDLYLNKFYIFGGGLVYAVTSILLVSLTHMIVVKSVKVEEAYVRTNLELKNKDKVQNDYVLRVTHDIKGHLAAIYSCLGVLRNNKIGELNDKQAEFVGRAYERTDLLVGFVRDLLNLTRKRQRQDEDFEEFSYRSLLDKMVASILPHSSEKSIEFNVVIDESVGNIIANPYAIEELYSNLLLNAVKYTPVNGQMELIVRNRPDYYITEISDSGIGIPKEELMKVFDEFFRGSNVPKEFRSGSGLGLSIAKQIVENHKGRIWVNSEPGVWTRFSFILPKNPAVPVTPRL